MHSYSSGRGTFTLPKLSDEKRIMFQGLRCNSHYILDECENCGRNVFVSDAYGIFCNTCEKGFTNWTCSNCNTDNPAKKTLYLLRKKENGGCFIATTVYGSPLVYEVVILRTFRDKVLARTKLGRLFINGYYRFSPFFAGLISKSENLKKLVRITFVTPLVRLVEAFLK